MDLSKKIRALAKKHSLPGLAVSVIREGEILLQEGFGSREKGTRADVTSRTMFHLASIAKTVTATSVLKLMESAKIRLSDRIADHLPEFAPDDDRAGAISIRHLLAHTSGLPDVEDFEWTRPRYDKAALRDHISSLTKLKLHFAPGSAHSYSDIGYEVLGRLVEKISNRPFEDYVRTNIFDPLEMNDSTFLIRGVDQSLLARPHVGGEEIKPSEIFPYNRKHAPSSTFYSNAADMTRWMRAHLAQGYPVLNRSSYAVMTRTTRVPKAVFWTRYGHGLFAGTHRRCRFFGHEGSDNGFRASMLVLPAHTIGITMLCNYDGAPLKEMMRAVMDLLVPSKSS